MAKCIYLLRIKNWRKLLCFLLKLAWVDEPDEPDELDELDELWLQPINSNI